MSSDLIAFLAARLDEAAAAAWAIHDVSRCDALLYEEDLADAAARTPDCDCGYPARMLREIDAKRKILGMHHPARPHPEFGFTYPEAARFCGWCGPGDNWQARQEPDMFSFALWPCGHARLLAAVYSDHPDYRPEWKPGKQG